MNLVKKSLGMLALTLWALTNVACTSKAQKVEKLLNGGSESGPWTLVKSEAKINGYSVFLGPDKKYYAYNVSNYKEGMTPEQFISSGTVYSGLSKSSTIETRWVVVASYTRESDRCPILETCTTSMDSWGNTYYRWTEDQFGWRDFVVDIYTDPTSGIVFEQGDTTSKDLETVGAALEEEGLSTVKSALVSQYGLSESRASELASMASSMKNIADSQGRALTERDLESLQVKAMGASLADYKNAKAKGDTKAIEKMTAKAASLNKISPEQAKRLMKQLGL